MILAFSGSRLGSNPASEAAFRRVIAILSPSEFHHGACRGWDAEAVRIVRKTFPLCKIVAHPGFGTRDGSERPDRDQESIEWSNEVLPEQNHFARNRAIVKACEHLLACPPTLARQNNGGTWFCVDFAYQHLKPITIVFPDGTTGH